MGKCINLALWKALTKKVAGQYRMCYNHVAVCVMSCSSSDLLFFVPIVFQETGKEAERDPEQHPPGDDSDGEFNG